MVSRGKRIKLVRLKRRRMLRSRWHKKTLDGEEVQIEEGEIKHVEPEYAEEVVPITNEEGVGDQAAEPIV